MKLVLVIFVSLAVLMLAIILLWPRSNDLSQSPTAQIGQNQMTTDPVAGTPLLIIGNKNAPVTLTEYGDFKCPNCAQFHTSTGQGIREDYVKKGDVRIVFRNIALIGPDSDRAAQGAYCANDQNKFAEYHDKVYEYMWQNYYQQGNYQAEFDDILTSEFLADTAQQLGMKKAKFIDCLDSAKYAVATQADLDAAEEDDARGTPFFVIADRTVTGPQPYSVFKTLIDLQLQ